MHGRDADTTAAQQQLTQPTTHTVGEQVTVHRNLDHPTWMTQEFVETAQGLQIQRTRRTDLPTEMYQAEVVATGTKNSIRCVRLNNGHWYRDADGTQVGSATFITRFDQEG